MLKLYLAKQEGIICNSPKRCFRMALGADLLLAEEVATCLLMTDDRNLTSHTYIEAIAEAIYSKLPRYAGMMRKLLNQIEQQLESEQI